MPTPTLNKSKIRNARVLYRVAYDVPLKQRGSHFVVQDDSRIRASLPTLRYLIQQRCKIVILTWAGRPDGEVIEKYKLDPVAKKLTALLRYPVKKLNDCVGPAVSSAVAGMKPGEVVLLENVRFHPEEETKSVKFMKQLAALGDVQVFDAFAQAHRNVASIVGPQKYLPTVSGFTVEREVSTLSRMMRQPKRPFVAIIGGAKIEDKVALVTKLLSIADYVLLGGMSANTILQIKGLQVGKSRVSNEAVKVARRLELTNNKLKIPVDVITATRISPSERTTLRAVSNVKSNELLLDIGPDTVKLYANIIKQAKTVLWSGPMGYFEMPQFAKGTIAIARAIARIKGETIVGGGDTEAALELSGVEKRIDFISTGGGAMLEYLAGKSLPGLKYLKLSTHS
ncbi:MAG: phosphoglycerate kinase [Patescibacteria group bacterium]